ncbi:hypothetical protein [Pseudomonas sp. D3-10]|uniref:hypothetical protein n=1 Tax=Pseudomonas sp. D3-10 TaxID=2817392 RepID=UPI003DA9FDD5
MKLIGSVTEMKIRETLICSACYIFNNVIILTFLEGMFGPISSAYVLSHTPDQGEDFYVLLVNGSIVVSFELSRNCGDPKPENFVAIEIEQYRKKLRGRHSQLKLAIAMDLVVKS